MHVKYEHDEVYIIYDSSNIAKVKVDNRQTNKRIGQKQFALDRSILGIEYIYILLFL